MTEGISIKYQGKACDPLFEFSRSSGLEPSGGFVHIQRDEFKDLQVKEALFGVETLEIKTQDRDSPGSGFLSVGDLVFSQTIKETDQEQTHEVRVSKVLLSERALEAPLAFDDDSATTFRVELTDIRELWGKRGNPIFEWVNVPKQGTDQGSATGDGSPVAQATTFKTASGLPLPPLILGSTNGGEPKKLKRILVEKILPALPGSPILKEFPADLEEAVPVGHVWEGWLPKDCLAALLKEFQLEFSLTLSSDAAIFHKGQGDLKVNGQTIDYRPSVNGGPNANVDDRVATARELLVFRRVPAVVVVLGPPTIATDKVKLEAVGEIDGKIVPLERALIDIGLTIDEACALAICPHGDRAAKFNLTQDGLSAFQRWAFKWFRLQGGPAKNAGRLPLLEGRPEVDEVGALRPHRVFSETHGWVSTLKSKLAEIYADGRFDALGIKRQISVENQIRGAASTKYVASYNVAFSEQSSGYEIDREQGLVRFHSIQGLLAQVGKTPEESRLEKAPARVEFEYGYRKKPGFDENLLLEHRYHSVWVRKSSDGAEASTPTVEQVAQIPAGSSPLVIRRPDLQQVDGLEGKTNKSILDAVAQDLAKNVLEVPQSTVGAVVNFCRPVPVETNGRVLSVTWRTTNGEIPEVVCHLGSFAPLAPGVEADLRTRAFGPLDGSIRASVVAPRGLSS